MADDVRSSRRTEYTSNKLTPWRLNIQPIDYYVWTQNAVIRNNARWARWRPTLAIDGSFTEVQSRRPRLVLGRVTAREDRALRTSVYIADIVLTWRKMNQPTNRNNVAVYRLMLPQIHIRRSGVSAYRPRPRLVLGRVTAREDRAYQLTGHDHAHVFALARTSLT